MSLKNRPTRYPMTKKPDRSFRAEYESLCAKRPLLPADIRRLETLNLLMMMEAKNAR